jgi:hypothetical protein
MPATFGDVGAPELRPGQGRSAPLTATTAAPRTADPFFPAGPATPDAGAGAGEVPTIRPQPRTSQAATGADPLFTRVTLGRTDDGNRFGMFLQVYADGTVIDSEGVHKASPEAMQGLAQALQDPELARADGHCGGPPTDFVEQVYAVVYRRKLGGLVATPFSYSGNTAGCSQAIRNLHAASEAFVSRMTSPGAGGAAAGLTPVAAAPTAAPATAPASLPLMAAPASGALSLPPAPVPAVDPSMLPPMVPVDTGASAPEAPGGSSAPPNTLILTPGE